MSETTASSSGERLRRWVMFLPLAGLVVTGAVGYALLAPRGEPAPKGTMPVEPAEATTEEVHQLCAACHAYPPPDSFPRWAWRKEVKQGYDFLHKDPSYRKRYPPLEAVVRYYEKRAPESLARLPAPVQQVPRSRLERQDLIKEEGGGEPGIAHVQVTSLFGKDKVEVLLCDALHGQVLTFRPGEAGTWRTLAQGLVCARAEVVDLDGDGHQDVLLACLGHFYATDDRVGSVVWLKGSAEGKFTPITLLDGIGRVADVRAADFNGDGKLDLVVAVFGWHRTGEILLLENRTVEKDKPVFVPRVLDERHGTTHVPVVDLNGDGKPDFVALITQEHEMVVAFVNEGEGRFRKETVYTAPHPGYGCNGLHVVDLDGNGDLDLVLSNGDAMDAPHLLKPYHGITWLENRGKYPFTAHRLADCYGAGSPVTGDFDGNGLVDIAFATFLPHEFFGQRKEVGAEAVVLLEQVERGKFRRSTLEVTSCDHPSCAVGDLDGDGRPELVVGNYIRGGKPGPALTIWRNKTEKKVTGGIR